MKDILSRIKAYSDQIGRSAEFNRYEDLLNLYPNLPGQREVHRCITSESIYPALEHADTILGDIAQMFGYEENSEAISSYFRYIIDYVAGKRKISNNIEMNWRLSNEGQPREMAVLQASI